MTQAIDYQPCPCPVCNDDDSTVADLPPLAVTLHTLDWRPTDRWRREDCKCGDDAVWTADMEIQTEIGEFCVQVNLCNPCYIRAWGKGIKEGR